MVSLLLPLIYLAFVSLGLPDSVLGAAWPSMYGELGVEISMMGPVSMLIAGGTIVSTLSADRLIKRFGTGTITIVSVAITAAAMLAFSVSRSYWLLLLFAIPYGLGAGSVDAALNNYVAVHYAARHMSFLHACWGIGATLGPYIMGLCLTSGAHWTAGYLALGVFQFCLVAVLCFSIPLWKKQMCSDGEDEKKLEILPKRKLLAIPGAKPIFLTFFCYCALETTAGTWASSYLVFAKDVTAESAAKMASIFYIGITAGRILSGIVADRAGDKTMVRIGVAVMTIGVAMIFLPFGAAAACVGLVMTGIGCAPVYPSLMHIVPSYFSPQVTQSMIGTQMAAAYVGSTIMPPLFGLLAEKSGFAIFPVYITVFLCGMIACSERLHAAVKKR